MIINATLISSLNACSDRYDNYVTNYGTSDFTVDDFLDLTSITYSDKIWVLRRLMNVTQARTFALLCAESVLPIYQAKYPSDNRVSDCINFLKGIKDLGNLSETEGEELKVHRAAAAAAAYAAADDAAAAAAYAAAYATAAAAYAADAAAAYAADAAAAYAADAAADAAAAYAADARKDQEVLNITFLKMAMSV